MNDLFSTSLDFAQDESFVKWVKNPDEATESTWQKYWTDNPQKRELIAEARELVAMATYRTYTPGEGKQEAIKASIEVAYGQWSLQAGNNRIGRSWIVSIFRPGIGYGIAASFAGLLLLGIGYLLFFHQSVVEYKTNYGQTLALTLPDSSTVVLNGNSRISYAKHWEAGTVREIEMEGEAYFSVRHTPDHSRFLVHLPDQLAVEVLGTEFDLVSRENKARVVLVSGQIKLTRDNPDGQESVLLAPGEMVQVARTRPLLVEPGIDAARYASWKDNKLYFDQTSIAEIATLLEQTYGYQVEILDPALNDRKFRGVFPADDVQVLINALETYFQIKVSQTGKSIKLDTKR